MKLLGQKADLLREARKCLDRGPLLQRLAACVDWPVGWRVADIGIKRLLPGRDFRLELEYAITLRKRSKSRLKSIYAVYPALQLENADISTAARLSEHGITNVFAQLPEWNMTIHSWDRDPGLTRAPCCLDSEFMAGKLASLGFPDEEYPGNKLNGSLRCRPMAYRRGKRLVVRYWDPSQGSPRCSLVGKCYASNLGERVAVWQACMARHLRRHTKGRVRVPSVLYYDCDLKMLFTGWAAPLLPQAAKHDETSWPRQAAQALAAIHATPLMELNRFDVDDQGEILERWQAVIRHLKPELAARSDQLIQELHQAGRQVDSSDPVVVHRDFYESQMAVGRRTATVYDLDTLAVGDRCLDVGNCLAHLWLWCLQRGVSPDDYATHVVAMLDAYESATSRVDDRSLGFYWASALYRVGAVHAFRDATSRHTHSLWGLVLPILRAERKGVRPAVVCSA